MPTLKPRDVADRLYGSRSATDEEINQNPKFQKIIKAQKSKKSALDGELGIFINPDGSFSTERSATVELDGKWVNIPLLVEGQDNDAIRRILSGEPSDEDYGRAIQRAKKRRNAGQDLPSYSSAEEAVAAAKSRSAGK